MLVFIHGSVMENVSSFKSQGINILDELSIDVIMKMPRTFNFSDDHLYFLKNIKRLGM